MRKREMSRKRLWDSVEESGLAMKYGPGVVMEVFAVIADNLALSDDEYYPLSEKKVQL